MAELGLVGDGPNSYQVLLELNIDLPELQFFSGFRTHPRQEFVKSAERFHFYVESDLAWGNTQSNLAGKMLHEQG